MRLVRRLALIASIAGFGACAKGGAGPDARGGGSPDAGITVGDTGVVSPDAAFSFDAGMPLDAPWAPFDGGPLPFDGGPLPVDAGPAPVDAGGVSPACVAALAAATFTFDTGAQGWTHAPMDGVSASWPLDPWSVGAPTIAPGACAQGTGCFGTGLTQNYAQCGRADLRSPTIDLRACAGETVVMVWEQWFQLWTGSYGSGTWFDGGLVELARDGTSSWQPAVTTPGAPGTVRINPSRGLGYSCIDSDNFYVDGRAGVVGTSGGWQTAEASFGTAPIDAPFRVRFAWASGVSSSTTNANTSRSGTAPGWLVDHVRFEVR